MDLSIKGFFSWKWFNFVIRGYYWLRGKVLMFLIWYWYAF